ncbi:MAG TPA: hypothetical protein VK487_11505 [Candidatus Bathyarchaeia archaeon]|nr:hypothetical protein [Candidatus Bathyarchaeia archaeon]
MPDNVIKKILSDMDKQGFPLEVQVTEILKTHGWIVDNQEAYFDAEAGKQRTVDIASVKDFEVMPYALWKKYPHRWAFQVRLIVECKKSIKPWVFYASDTDKKQIEQSLSINAQVHEDKIEQLNYPEEFRGTLEEKDTDLILGFRQELARPAIFERLATIAYEPFTNGKGYSIHKARMQVCKALVDLKRKLEQDSIEILHCILLKPVIVFDGQLYVYQNKNLTESEGLYYLVSHNNSRFHIEIIRADYLRTYLERIEKSIGNFQRGIQNQNK